MAEQSSRHRGTRSASLPNRLSSFVGRADEIERLVRMVAGHRLVSLVGAPGVGKTRLAVEVAIGLGDDVAEQACFVPLAGLAESELVPHAVASALGVGEQPGPSMLETLATYLEAHAVLLVLDNCEHLLEACAELAETVLSACPGVRMLATSREPLQIEGEMTWRVPSLSLPAHGQIAAGSDPLQFEAVRLFVDRAVAVAPGPSLTEARAQLVAQICHRLDGIPLAIELAAAQTRVLSLEQIAAAARRARRSAGRRQPDGAASLPDAAGRGRVELRPAGRRGATHATAAGGVRRRLHAACCRRRNG